MTTDFRIAPQVVAQADLPDDAQGALEAVALRIPSLRESLCRNPRLSEEGWLDLYSRKPLPKAPEAISLVARPLSKTQRLHVLEVDRRPAVLTVLVEHNALEIDEQELLLASKGFGPKLAAVLVKKPWTETGLRKRMALSSGGQVLLDALADSPVEQFSTEEALELLSRFPEWGPSMDDNPRGKGQRSRSLIRLLGRRPELLPAAVAAGQHSSLVAAASGSLHLREKALQYQAARLSESGEVLDAAEFRSREYALMALVNNPPTAPEVVAAVERAAEAQNMARLQESAAGRARRHPEAVTVPYSEVVDPDDLKWLLRRALPSWEYESKARPFELAALAANPTLAPYDAENVAEGLNTTYGWEVLGEALLPALQALVKLTEGTKHCDWLPDVVKRLQAGETLESGYSYSPVERPYTAEQALGQHVRSLAWESNLNQVLLHVAARLGGKESSWEHFFTLVDEFDGKVEDVVQLSELL